MKKKKLGIGEVALWLAISGVVSIFVLAHGLQRADDNIEKLESRLAAMDLKIAILELSALETEVTVDIVRETTENPAFMFEDEKDGQD